MSEQDEKRMYFIIIMNVIWTLLCIVGFIFIFESYNQAEVQDRALYFVVYVITTLIVTVVSVVISKDIYE